MQRRKSLRGQSNSFLPYGMFRENETIWYFNMSNYVIWQQQLRVQTNEYQAYRRKKSNKMLLDAQEESSQMLDQDWISITVDGAFHGEMNRSAVGGCVKNNIRFCRGGYGMGEPPRN